MMCCIISYPVPRQAMSHPPCKVIYFVWSNLESWTEFGTCYLQCIRLPLYSMIQIYKMPRGWSMAGQKSWKMQLVITGSAQLLTASTRPMTIVWANFQDWIGTASSTTIASGSRSSSLRPCDVLATPAIKNNTLCSWNGQAEMEVGYRTSFEPSSVVITLAMALDRLWATGTSKFSMYNVLCTIYWTKEMCPIDCERALGSKFLQ